LDKRIPIALILAVMMQTAGAVWWAASISARLDQTEARASRLELNQATAAELATKFSNALAGIAASQIAMERSLTRIENSIDRQRNKGD
jgi:hypothetical protein